MRHVVATLWSVAVICVIAASVISTGCAPPKSNGRADNVVKVIVHSPREYTIMHRASDNEIKSFSLTLNGNHGTKPIRIITDVPKDKPMWVSWRNKTVYRSTKEYVGYAEIHVHSEKDIEGGPKED